MLPSEGVQLQMGLSSVGDLLKSHRTQLEAGRPRSAAPRLSGAHRFEDVDVLVPGHQMGAFGDACGRLQLVSRQHPDLRGKQEDEEKLERPTVMGWVRFALQP